MDITEVSILHHIAMVFVVLWILSSLGFSHLLIYFVSFLYLYEVNVYYTLKLRRRLHSEEKKQANQKKLLSDTETIRWLNHAVEKVWPICMEEIASQKFLLPVVPWFLDKYRPWPAAKAVVQHLNLGRNPPMFTEIRAVHQSSDDDHLVLDLGMNFLAADDMSTVLAVQLNESLGFGLWTKMYITGMHIEGRVLVGVKFLRNWPYIGRLRVCFVEPPYFQMTVKPIFSHGLDVTELPGVAGWLDKILTDAFEQTLVEPNMLVVDVEMLASKSTETWFAMDEKCPIAVAILEVVEAADLKPADLNGLADPYVKGQLGSCKFRTKTQKKTLAPKWQEEFEIPIHSWESSNILSLEVLDQDRFVDDSLGFCSIDINNFRGGLRHDMWLPLRKVKIGRLHLAVTVLENDEEEAEHLGDKEHSNDKEDVDANQAAQHDPAQQAQKLADEFELIHIEGQEQTGIWVHRPGSNICQTWVPRKREGKRSEIEIIGEDIDCVNSSVSIAAGCVLSESSNEPENLSVNTSSDHDRRKESLQKIGSAIKVSPREVTYPTSESLNSKAEGVSPANEEVRVKFVLNDDDPGVTTDNKVGKEPISPKRGHTRGMSKSILKQASRSARTLRNTLSRKESCKSRNVPLENEPSPIIGAEPANRENVE